MTDHRVAVVTGAGSGIGRESALRLARQGISVIACDRDEHAARKTVEALRTEGGEHRWQVFDVADREGVDSAVRDVVADFGRIDILVNAAGHTHFRPFVDLTEEEWDRTMTVHAKGTFNCVQSVLPHMQAHRYGRIVCIASVGAMSGSIAHSHYAAAKAAVIGFAKALCREIGPYGVTINCVAPGAIDTPLLRSLSSEETYSKYSETPVGRIGLPEDVAHAVEFLASEGTGFITGWVVSVNGGVYT